MTDTAKVMEAVDRIFGDCKPESWEYQAAVRLSKEILELGVAAVSPQDPAPQGNRLKYWQCPNDESHTLKWGKKIYGTQHYRQYCTVCPDTIAIFGPAPGAAPAGLERTLSPLREALCGTAENVLTSMNKATHPTAKPVGDFEAHLLPDQEWKALSKDSQEKVSKWFELATKFLQQILDCEPSGLERIAQEIAEEWASNSSTPADKGMVEDAARVVLSRSLEGRAHDYWPEYNKAVGELDVLRRERDWIDVTVALPKVGGTYLVGGYIDQMFYSALHPFFLLESGQTWGCENVKVNFPIQFWCEMPRHPRAALGPVAQEKP